MLTLRSITTARRQAKAPVEELHGERFAPKPIPAAPEPGGIVAGAVVATARGWRPVEEVKVGDLVMTFDNGPQPVAAVSRRLYPYDSACGTARPLITVPAGTLGNARAMALLPEQIVLTESDAAEAILGDPFAPLRAEALTALPAVRARLPEASVVVVTLAFENDEAVFVEGQALAVCPAARVLAPASLDEALFADRGQRYRPVAGAQATLIAAGLATQHAGPQRVCH